MAHVSSYTIVTSATVGLLWVVLGLDISSLGFLAGQLVSAVTHYWADRRFTLERLCDRLSVNWLWLGAAALVTALM